MQISPEELQKLAGIISGTNTTDTDTPDITPVLPPVTATAAPLDMRGILDKFNSAKVEESESDIEVEDAGEWDNEPEEKMLDQPKGEPVDTSLRRLMGADYTHVKVAESAIEDYTSFDLYEAYESYKSTSESDESEEDAIVARDPEGHYVVMRGGKGFRIMGLKKLRGEFTHAGYFTSLAGAKTHAEKVVDAFFDDELHESNADGEYVELLNSHDWFYEMSDNSSVYNTGRNERIKLNKLQKEIDTDAKLWNQYAPARFKKQASTAANKPKERPANSIIKYQVFDTTTGEQIGELHDQGKDALYVRDKLAISSGDFNKYSYRFVYIDPDTNELIESDFDNGKAMFVIPTDASSHETELATQIADEAGVALDKAMSFDEKDIMARSLYDAAERLGLADVVFDLIHTTHANADKLLDEKRTFKGWNAVCNGVEKLIPYGTVKTMNDALRHAVSHFKSSPQAIDIKPIYESTGSATRKPSPRKTRKK